MMINFWRMPWEKLWIRSPRAADKPKAIGQLAGSLAAHPRLHLVNFADEAQVFDRFQAGKDIGIVRDKAKRALGPDRIFDNVVAIDLDRARVWFKDAGNHLDRGCFPAPFGPRKPKISPCWTDKSMWSTAWIFPL